MARLRVCAPWIAALATVVRAANAAPTTPAATPTEHVARFALVLGEPRAALEACGGLTMLEEGVERRLERDALTSEETADGSLVVTSDPRPGSQWQVHIVERDASGAETGQRDVLIDAADCAKGVETLAVVLAIMIGPPRSLPGAPPGLPPPPPPPAPVQESKPPPTRPRAPEAPLAAKTEAAHPAARWSASPVVGLSAGSGILPGISWGIEGGVLVHPPVRRISFIARGEVWPSRAAGTQPEVRLDRLSLSLLACHRTVRRSAATLDLCTGVDGGWLEASAPAIRGVSRSATRALVDVPFEARWAFALSHPSRRIRIEPFAAAQLAVLVLRDRFVVRDRLDREVTLHRSAPIALTATLGLAVQFSEN